MEKIINNTSKELQFITPDDGYHYFFGYYDMRATGEKGKHLCHRVAFFDRDPNAQDVAELGYLENGKFVKFAETTAWNFQQGSMLQYHPELENTVFYNACENGKFCTVIHNFATGEKKYADRATACISPNGKWGLGINFGRIFTFRAGYGYAGYTDDFANENAPKDDGVFLVDMENGSSKQIVSYQDLYKISGFTKEDKILINHITFNTESNAFLMLVRNFPKRDANGKVDKGWSTSVIISDLEGNLRPLLKNTYFSHYYWRNENQIVAHCTVEPDKRSLYIIDTDTGAWKEYDMPYFSARRVRNQSMDIHCSFSPDGKYIIGDGYPADGYRYIVGYNMQTGTSKELLLVRDCGLTGDIRCDLHARFTWGGKYITFDTNCADKRQIVQISADILDF